VHLFQVPADDGEIGNPLAVVVDIGQLALGSLGESLAVHPIGQAGDPQEHLGLHDEWAWIGQAKKPGPKV